MAVSMGDVARHAGVSQRTVSNVVSGAANVAPATRAKVEASLAALGYRPNLAARQLRSGRTGTVTLAVPRFGERYFADFADAVIRHASLHGTKVLVETTGADHGAELELLRGNGGPLTDGLIIVAVTLGAGDEREARSGYPIVLVGDRELSGPIDYVGMPNRAATRAAVEHLIDSGRRRIALLGARPDSFDTYVARRAGFLDALESRGVAPDPELVIATPWDRESAEAAMERFLASGAAVPDAVFAMNDSAAFGAIRALRRRDLEVPRDVAVAGFDDVVESRFSTPSLTTISPSPEDIAEESLGLLRRRLDDPGCAPVHRHVGFRLLVRESTA